VTALEAVGVYAPDRQAPVAEYLPPLGVPPDLVRRYEHFYGFSRIPQHGPPGLAPLLHAAATALAPLAEARARARVRFLLHARTMLVAVPYPTNPLHEVRAQLGLEHATGFTVTDHACASGLLAVDLAGRMLQATGDPDALALVITGERTFTGMARVISDAAVMGEAAAAALVRTGGDRDRVLGYATRSLPHLDSDPWAQPQDPSVPQGYARALAGVVTDAADAAGLDLDDLTLVLPHNVNRLSLLRLARDLGLPAGRLYLRNIPRTGHCFCADGFINYVSAREEGLLRPGHPYVMTAVGLGTTFSALVLRH
jgi:3-oxoacyl-[acyl-carrier-protein] synthase III